jgi:hypothetical protein
MSFLADLLALGRDPRQAMRDGAREAEERPGMRPPNPHSIRPTL